MGMLQLAFDEQSFKRMQQLHSKMQSLQGQGECAKHD
jgi:hypothetical protein